GLLGLADLTRSADRAIELRVAAVLAHERLELREDGEHVRATCPTESGPPPDRTLSKRSMAVPPHLGQGWPNFMVQGNPVQLEKAAVGFPIVGPDFFNRSANCLRNFATFGAM